MTETNIGKYLRTQPTMLLIANQRHYDYYMEKLAENVSVSASERRQVDKARWLGFWGLVFPFTSDQKRSVH